MIRDILNQASGEMTLLSDKIKLHYAALEKLDQAIENSPSQDDLRDLRSQVSEELLIYSEKLDELEERINNELKLKEEYQQEIINQLFNMKEEIRNEINIEINQKLEQFQYRLQGEIEKADTLVESYEGIISKLEVEEAEEETSSGIIIPDTAKEKPQQGKVIAVGPGKVEDGNKIDMSVSEGDRVLYGKYAGTEITLDGEDYMIMRESDILGIIE